MSSASQQAAIRFSVERCGKGVCIDCGVEVSYPDAKWPRCLPCQRSHREKHRDVILEGMRDRHAKRIADGICPDCPNPIAPKRKKCRACLDKNLAIVRRRKADRKR